MSSDPRPVAPFKSKFLQFGKRASEFLSQSMQRTIERFTLLCASESFKGTHHDEITASPLNNKQNKRSTMWITAKMTQQNKSILLPSLVLTC